MVIRFTDQQRHESTDQSQKKKVIFILCKLHNDIMVLKFYRSSILCSSMRNLYRSVSLTSQADFALCFLHSECHFLSALVFTAPPCLHATHDDFLSCGELLVSHASNGRLAPGSILMLLEQKDMVSAGLLDSPSALIFFPLHFSI